MSSGRPNKSWLLHENQREEQNRAGGGGWGGREEEEAEDLVESRGLRGYEMQKRSPPPFGFSLPPPLPPRHLPLAVCPVRSRVLFESSARGTRTEEWAKQKMQAASTFGPSWPLFVRGGKRLERESTHLDKPSARSKRTGRRREA